VLLEVTAPDLVSATVSVSWSGGLDNAALVVAPVGTQQVAWGLFSEPRDVAGQTGAACPVFKLFVGLDHPWFACQGRAPTRNDVTLHLSGESLYQAVWDDLGLVKQRVHASTWWWQSQFELVRPAGQPAMSGPERFQNTAISLLESMPGVDVRVLVGAFAPQLAAGLAYLNTDPLLRSHAADLDDGFEVMSQGNPTPVPVHGDYVPGIHPVPFVSRLESWHPELAGSALSSFVVPVTRSEVTAEVGSWHQKTWALDGRIAYVTGMNVKSTDWDTVEHAVFEPRRMKFMSSNADRDAVAQKLALPDLGPRKDYGVRVAGPLARDLDDVFKQRWDWGIARHDLFSDTATSFDLLPRPEEPPGGIMAQLVVTMPEPFGERSIEESVIKAVRNAKDLVYIEDQYFRVPMLLPALQYALTLSPALNVVVVTKPVPATDGGKKWTVYMDQELRKLAGARYLLLQAMSYGVGQLQGPGSQVPVFQPIDVHSKILLVDDVYLSVGSCNRNDRGFLLEGEANVSVLDQPFVRESRIRLLQNLSGDAAFDWTSPGAAVSARLAAIAASNEALRMEADATAAPPSAAPTGFVYPLEFSPDYLLDVGPDLY